MLPTCVVEPLQAHLQTVRQFHHQDLERGYGSVYLPFALERKYPHADRSWIWQSVFPVVVSNHYAVPSGLEWVCAFIQPCSEETIVTRKIIVADSARSDLEHHFAYIAENNADAALRFFDAARKTFADIASMAIPDRP